MRAAATLAALALLVLAGCFQAGTTRPDYAKVQTDLEAAAAKVLRLDHDDPLGHTKADLHRGAFNLDLVGYSNGVDESGDPSHIPDTAFWNEIAVTPTHTYLAAESRDGSYGGFSILDTTDKAHPQVLSHFKAQSGFDIEVNADESLAFLASQRNSPEQVAGGLAATQDPRADLPRGIYVVDISDKRAPTLDSFVPMPVNGPHTLTYFRHPNGNDYLLVCTYDLVTDPVTNAITGAVPASQRMVVYLIGENPLSGQVPGAPTGPRVSLTPVAQFQILDPGAPGLVFPHDTRVAVDPTNPSKVYITLAYWDKGLRILDFSDPPSPPTAGGVDPAQTPLLREVGSFTEFSPSAFNNIHLAKRVLVAGTPVTITEPEIIGADEETGQVTFLDTSDVARPSKLSWWTLPPQDPPLGVRGLDFSPHNFDVWDGKVALAHYHAGVWVIDIHDQENLHAPKSVAFYMPAFARTNLPSGVLQPDVWGVVQQGGYLFVSDEATGLHILKYTGP